VGLEIAGWTMSLFLLALFGFVLIHVGLSATPARARLVTALGEWPYRALFSAISGALLFALIVGFGMARQASFDLNPQLYDPPAWGRHVTYLGMLLAMLFIVPAYLAVSPTALGMERFAGRAKAVGMQRITRHPFLWGVAIWGVAHLFSNGRLAEVLLFGGLAVMCLLGTRSIDRKSAARDPQGWSHYRDQTSNLPFAAVISGRNQVMLTELWWRWLVAGAVFALVFVLHGVLFGAVLL